MLRNLTLYSSIGFLAVLSILLLVIIVYTWLSRKMMSRMEADMELYTKELDDFLEANDNSIPESFFSQDISPKKNIQFLTRYIQGSCVTKKNQDIDRIKEYSLKVGLTDTLRKTALKGNEWKSANALRLLAEVGDHSDIDIFKAVLDDDVARPAILAAAIGLANNNDKDLLPLLLNKLYDSNNPNRDEVLSVLSCYYPDAIKPCIELISDSSLPAPLRSTLIDFVGVKRAQESKQTIEDILKQSTEGEMQLHAIEALEKVGDEDSCDVILPYLEDDDFRVRLKAVNALERLAHDKYMPEAEKLLSDSHLFVRRNAAEAITRMGAKGLDLIKTLTSSEDANVSIITKLVLAEHKYGKVRWRFRYGDSIP